MKCSSSAQVLFYSLGDAVSLHTDHSAFNSPSLSCHKLPWVSVGHERPDCRYAHFYFLGTVQQFAKMARAHTHIYVDMCVLCGTSTWAFAGLLQVHSSLFMGPQSHAAILHVLAQEGKVASEGFCSTFSWCRQCLRRNGPHLSPGHRNTVRPGSLLPRDVSDLNQSSRVMQREEMHEQLSGPYVMFLQLICTAIEVARH